MRVLCIILCFSDSEHNSAVHLFDCLLLLRISILYGKKFSQILYSVALPEIVYYKSIFTLRLKNLTDTSYTTIKYSEIFRFGEKKAWHRVYLINFVCTCFLRHGSLIKSFTCVPEFLIGVFVPFVNFFVCLGLGKKKLGDLVVTVCFCV